MTTSNFLGYAAGLMTTLAFVPQVVRTIRTRSAKDLSWGMLLIFILGVILWLAYGVVLDSWPIILCNSLTLGLNLVIVAVKFQAPARAAVPEEVR
jgi:MtN3 and saliva related transmembrane protein